MGRNTPSHLEIWDNVMKEIHEACAFSSSENLKNFSYSGLLGVKLSKTTGERYCELCDKENCLFEYFRFTDLPKEHICYSQEKKRAVAG